MQTGMKGVKKGRAPGTDDMHCISRVMRPPSLLIMMLHNWLVAWKAAVTILLQRCQRAESFILSHTNTQVT